MRKEVRFLKNKKKSTKILKLFLLVSFLILLIGFVYGTITYIKVDKNVDVSLFRKGNSTVSKIFYYNFEDRKDRIGTIEELKDEELFLEKSEWASFYDIPEDLKNAFIAVEDKRFYKHNGVDWLRTGKAFLNYIFKFDKSGYGGSTITQQLIKNITGENQFSPKRKFEEIIRAKNIEKNMSKNEILETYLNIVYMANNCYGVAAASDLYFNKSINELSVAECASLASIVQNPAKYNPYLNSENNRLRRNIVLREMLNQKMITQEEYNAAINENIVVSSNVEKRKNSGIYSWYTEKLLSDVSKDLAEKFNLKIGAARNLILRGGYNIYSVIDPQLQKYAEKIYENNLAYFDNDNGTYPQSSCVILDPYTSDILAIVGGTGKKESNLIFNRATDAKRPPGSVLKPLSVYSVGIDKNVFDYSTVYDDTPLLMENGSYWPKNSPDRYRGLVPLSFALEHSINTVAVKALRDIGIKNSIEYLKKYGITVSEGDTNESSLALGQLEKGESLLNLTNAYSCFVNNGYMSKPKTYIQVTDSYGNVILNNNNDSVQVISEDSAYITTKMLENVVENGTASSVKLKEMISTAGKTGTSSNSEDKWFIGFTPYYVCGVWTGYDTPKPMQYVKNPSCKIFDELMIYAHKNLDVSKDFQRPIGVVEQDFCFDSGIIPKQECENDIRGNRVLTGYYKFSRQPKSLCDIHKEVEINKNDGFIAQSYTPFWRKRRAVLLDYFREKNDNFAVLDEEYLIQNRKRENKKN